MTVINTNGPNSPTTLTPDVAIEQVKTMRSQLPEVSALSAKQRRAMMRNPKRNSEPIVQASLNVIGVSDHVSAALGTPVDDVRTLQQDAILWKAVEEEVRNLLAGIAGANQLRRQKLADLGAKAYIIGSQLAKDPENEVLVSHVEEIRRLRRLARRKKPATPATPEQPE